LQRDTVRTLLALSDHVLEEMITQQREKVLRLARQVVPHLSPEDVLNPNDFPALHEHPTFDYEDGLLAGLLSAQMALRAELGSRLRSDTE
jgi:hypothetical protein